MSATAKELSFGASEFLSLEQENHQFRRLTKAVKTLNLRLTELEKTAKSIVGRQEKQLSANMHFHCKTKTYQLTKEYRKLAHKFLENVVSAQKEKAGSSFVSTDQMQQGEETMKTRATEQSFSSQQQEFERLELDRLTKSVAEIHLLLEQQLKPTLCRQGGLSDRVDAPLQQRETAAVVAEVEGEVALPRESFFADNCIRALSISIICLVMLLLWKSTLSDG